MRKSVGSKEQGSVTRRSSLPPEWEHTLDALLEHITKTVRGDRVPVVANLIRAALKLAKESPGTLNLKIAATTLKELRYSFKIFYPHRFEPKITMFGSARVLRGTPLYDCAKAFAEEAVKQNYFIITGGGPGIMAAGNEGADRAGIGLNIKLPMEQSPNRFIDSQSILIHYKYFFTRKLFLVKEAAAFAFFPGGFGTFDEAFEVLTLLQTGKSNMIPVVMVEPEGFEFWRPFTEFVDRVLVEHGFISEQDQHLYRIFTSPSDAVRHIVHFYSAYHSMRFVKDKLVLRLKREPSSKLLKQLNKEFSTMCVDGKLSLSAPLEEEANEPELKELPRLIFKFDRRSFGTLRLLIDRLNDQT